jgi:hypothetical protein
MALNKMTLKMKQNDIEQNNSHNRAITLRGLTFIRMPLKMEQIDIQQNAIQDKPLY